MLLVGCAADDPKVTHDMSGTDFGSDFGVEDLKNSDLPDFTDDMSINCTDVPVEDCVQFFGQCQTVWLYDWHSDKQCYGAIQTEGLCLPMNDVGDDGQNAIVDPFGVCWGILEGLAEAPSGWSQFYGVSCACIEDDQMVENCDEPWEHCSE